MAYKPNYTITNRILNAISKIESLNSYISKADILPIWEKKLRHKAKIKSSHYSTAIEGNRLTLNQVEKVSKNEKVTGATEKDVKEVHNYFNVLDYIEKISEIEKTISHKIILKMHYITMDGILSGSLKGEYRNQQNVIKDTSTGEVVYLPPAAEHVYGMMDEFVTFLNAEKEIHLLLKAGISHYELVRIHPFMDGNGRCSRALTMLVLYLNSYDIRKLFALEEYYERDRERYYCAIESVQKNNGDLTEWLEYFLEGMVFELERVKNEIEKIKELKQEGVPKDLNPRQISVVSYIQRNGNVTNKNYRKLFHVSNKTAQTDLQKLVDRSILIIEGKGRSVKYRLK
ncbi:MAG: Fic family protein [Elusimicrobia bacterium]|nr:Fic family protein [Elusimicrobiota bacterium]